MHCRGQVSLAGHSSKAECLKGGGDEGLRTRSLPRVTAELHALTDEHVVHSFGVPTRVWRNEHNKEMQCGITRTQYVGTHTRDPQEQGGGRVH